MPHAVADLVRWAGAGMSDGESVGVAGMPVTGWLAPLNVWQAGGALAWSTSDGFKVVEQSRKMLDQFVRVTSPADVVRFARRWGVMTAALAPDPHRSEYTEPGRLWLERANDARVLLRIASRLHLGEAVAASDWSSLQTTEAEPREAFGAGIVRISKPPMMGPAREVFMRILDDWIAGAGVRPTPTWHLEPKLELRPGSMWGALVMQLTYTAMVKRAVAVCSSCATPYHPRRQPAAGRRNYCDECRAAGAPVRDAKQARLERLRNQGGQ